MNQAKQSRIEFEAWEYILPAMQEIARVSAKGFAKYGPGNWARTAERSFARTFFWKESRAGVM